VELAEIRELEQEYGRPRNLFRRIERANREASAIRKKLVDLHEALEMVKTAVKEREAMLRATISSMRREDGKPLYSNDTLREAAFYERRAEDDVLPALDKKRRELETAIAVAEARLATLTDRRRLNYHRLSLIEAELRALGG